MAGRMGCKFQAEWEGKDRQNASHEMQVTSSLLPPAEMNGEPMNRASRRAQH
jgi:hypothetical protein